MRLTNRQRAFWNWVILLALIGLIASLFAGCAWTSAKFEVNYPDGRKITGSYFSSRDSTVEVTTNGTIKAEGKASIVIDAQAKAMGHIAHEAAKGAMEGAKP